MMEILSDVNWTEVFKICATLFGGGLAGAFVNNYYTNKRNRIQPVNMKLDISNVDLPAIMKGYDAQITVSGQSNGELQTQVFKKLAIVRIELENTGVKDIDSFDLGLNFPEGTDAIGFQPETNNRKHLITCAQNVSMTTRFSELDFIIKPFNRENKYVLTLLTSTDGKDLRKDVKFSHSWVFRRS